jgi:putative transposase
LHCPLCNAPHSYLYLNNGKIKSQLKCKVCNSTFRIDGKYRETKSKYFCPYCNYSLFVWKRQNKVTIYKCPNDNCPHRFKALHNLNPAERLLAKLKSSQFKLSYQYREFHFTLHELKHSAPESPKISLNRIYNSQNILGLILTFYVSFAMSARKTALLLRWVFQINISYQTVLNYAEASAFYCHRFNLANKGQSHPVQAGDEAYIKINGKHHYTFFFIDSKKRAITSYHVSDNRGTLPATAAMLEAKRSVPPDKNITFITDGNPSYPSGIHFLNSSSDPVQDIQHRKVIGLQNLDSESEEFRPYKQLIERLNRTYKYHIKPAYGFNTFNGAMALTTLFVTFYNFLRPHMALKYKVPIYIKNIASLPTIQAKWIKILSLAPG